MSILDKSIIDRARKAPDRMSEARQVFGVVGIKNASDGSYTLRPNDGTGNIYVTLENGTIDVCEAPNIAYIGGAEIRMVREFGRLVAIGRDLRKPEPERPIEGLRAGKFRGSGNEEVFEGELFKPGILLSKGNLTLQFESVGFMSAGNIPNYATRTVVDLTSSVPGTSGQRRYTIVGINATDGTLTTVDGTAVARGLTVADMRNALALVQPEVIPLFAVDVRNGDTAIAWNRLFDVRQYAGGTATLKQNVTSTPDTVTTGAEYVLVNVSAAVALTLPSAADYEYRGELVIKDSGGNAGSNTITITRAGSDTIDGGTSTTITTNYGVVRLIAVSSSAWGIV